MAKQIAATTALRESVFCTNSAYRNKNSDSLRGGGKNDIVSELGDGGLFGEGVRRVISKMERKKPSFESETRSCLRERERAIVPPGKNRLAHLLP